MTIMLIEQDAELGQLRQTIGQLHEEEEKMAGWAEKLADVTTRVFGEAKNTNFLKKFPAMCEACRC